MTESDSAVRTETVERIERGAATQPWRFDETTARELDGVTGLRGTLDSVFVPWDAEDIVDEAEVLFTIDRGVLRRRELDVTDVIERAVEIVESDRRVAERVVWDQIEPTATIAEIDDLSTRVRIHWDIPGGDE